MINIFSYNDSPTETIRAKIIFENGNSNDFGHPRIPPWCRDLGFQFLTYGLLQIPLINEFSSCYNKTFRCKKIKVNFLILFTCKHVYIETMHDHSIGNRQ